MTKFERVVIQLLVIIANRTVRGTSPADRLDIDAQGWPIHGGKPLSMNHP